MAFRAAAGQLARRRAAPPNRARAPCCRAASSDASSSTCRRPASILHPPPAASPLGTRAFGIGYTTCHGSLGKSDEELFEEVFRPVGVSEEQFQHLMRHGVRCRAGVGGVVVAAGKPLDRVALVITGTAVAYKPQDDEDGVNFRPQPVCKYVGKLSDVDKPSEALESDVPVRGSVIGGSALVDGTTRGKTYPTNIVASTPMEWVEWENDKLLGLIKAPKMRALQASVYHLLYVELITTLYRDKVVSKRRGTSDPEAAAQALAAPSTRQLLSLSAFVAVPFFGFGFADNAIMIVCGDLIDAKFGAALGLSTMAAAGLGNWVSDVCGLGIGDAIERSAVKMGLSNGNLTPIQERMTSSKMVTLFSRIVGITLGCFAGMIPLLFLTPTKKEFANEDLELFDNIFGPSGLSTSQFSDLLEKGSRKSVAGGQQIVTEGEHLTKLILLLKGEAQETYPDTGKLACKYVGRLEEPPPGAAASEAAADGTQPGAAKLRGGAVIGAEKLLTAERAKESEPYTREVVASTAVELIEWELSGLDELMAQDKGIGASIMSILCTEVISRVKHDKKSGLHKRYRELLMAVIADGYVDEKERQLMQERQHLYQVTDEDHALILQELGWNQEAWERGTLAQFSGMSYKATSGTNSDDLLRAAAVLEEVARRMKS